MSHAVLVDDQQTPLLVSCAGVGALQWAYGSGVVRIFDLSISEVARISFLAVVLSRVRMKRHNFSERVLTCQQCALAEDFSNLIPFKALLLQQS